MVRYKICEKCSVAPLLKELIATEGKSENCTLCGEQSSKTIDTTSTRYVTTIKTLIRYHYSESEYHSKLGGDDFDFHFKSENPIFKVPNSQQLDIFEDFVQSFIWELWQGGDVSIVTAYGRDIYNHRPMTAVSLGKSQLLEMIRSELASKNYYLVEDIYKNDFEKLIDRITLNLPEQSEYFRARMGSNLIASNFDWRTMGHEEEFHEPYKENEIGAPPIDLADAGRINRSGVSYLYLATDAETAVSEVRPHPAENVSVGKFTSSKQLKIADFSKHSLDIASMTDDTLSDLELIIAIEKTLSTAVSPSLKKRYSVTQFIAEIIRKIGFDGLIFKSSVGHGQNLVIFEPSIFEYTAGSGKVYKVTSVKYSIENQALFDPNDFEDYDYIRDVRT